MWFLTKTVKKILFFAQWNYHCVKRFIFPRPQHAGPCSHCIKMFCRNDFTSLLREKERELSNPKKYFYTPRWQRVLRVEPLMPSYWAFSPVLRTSIFLEPTNKMCFIFKYSLRKTEKWGRDFLFEFCSFTSKVRIEVIVIISKVYILNFFTSWYAVTKADGWSRDFEVIH